MRKQQSGFTLIELVMVIVILGILAAFALPRFADMSADARRASLQGALAAMKSASAIAHSAQLSGGLAAGASVTLEGTVVTMANRYPTANAAGIIAASQVGTDFTVAGTGPVTVQANGAATPATCQITYTAGAAPVAPETSSPPTFAILTAGC